MDIIRYIKYTKNPQDILLTLASKGLFPMRDAKYLKLIFKSRMGYFPDLNNPRTFNEKMQWLKLHNRRTEYTLMVDKYAAKQYVAEKIGKKYVVPLVRGGVWNKFEDIDFDKLPDRFVLKSTHDCGGIAICQDRKEFNINVARKKLNKSLSRNLYYAGREWPYKNVKPRIIAEEYLENNAEGCLHDYKVWCFHGKPTYIQYISGRLNCVTYERFYDFNWKPYDFTLLNPILNEEVPAPQCLEELYELSGILSKGLPFLRVDFYVLDDGSVRFGEMTFYPNCGFEKWKPESMDYELGKLINIDSLRTQIEEETHG